MKENPVSREIAEELLKRLLPYINVNDWGAVVATLQVQLGRFKEGEVIGNYNYTLRDLKKGDFVECAHTNSKNLTIGKKYELLDTFFVYPDNKWIGVIKTDNSNRIKIRETRRFIKG